MIEKCCDRTNCHYSHALQNVGRETKRKIIYKQQLPKVMKAIVRFGQQVGLC